MPEFVITNIYQSDKLLVFNGPETNLNDSTTFYITSDIKLVNSFFSRFGYNSWTEIVDWKFQSQITVFSDAVKRLIYGLKSYNPDDLLDFVIIPALKSGQEPCWHAIDRQSVKDYYLAQKQAGLIINHEYCLDGSKWVSMIQKYLPDQIIINYIPAGQCQPGFHFKIITSDDITHWEFTAQHFMLTTL